ncbi:MAG: histidinol dehydrogenase, partial [Burkholderiaceae bacterium]|nr:histidinol dehydrogenase [Burkholderiaceae bacterium]
MAQVLNIPVLRTTDADFEQRFTSRLFWSGETDHAIESRVADIIADVRARGDQAVMDYTAKFDGLQVASMAELEISQADMASAFERLPQVQRDALTAAAQRIKSYHQAQKAASGESWQYTDEQGNLLGQKVTPLDRV